MRDVVGGEKLYVLVDEYDRAPMEEYISDITEYGVEGSTTASVKGALQEFLHTVKDLGCPFLVAGINTMSGAHTLNIIIFSVQRPTRA